MKKALITIAGLLIVLLAGFYFYTLHFKPSQPPALWDYVPADAVFVYENKAPAFTKKTQPDFAAWLREGLRQDSVFISPLRNHQVLLSLHVTGKDFGILYYLSDSSILSDIAFRRLTSAGKQKRRIFEGFTIVEMPAAHGAISYTTIDNNIIFSRQSFLVEDVIRLRKYETTGYQKRNASLFRLLSKETGSGKLYSNINALSKFSALFLTSEIKSTLFKNLGAAVGTELKLDDHTLLLNGFATDSAGANASMLSLFNDQHPVPSGLRSVVSNRTMVFVHYGVPDFQAFEKRKSAWLKASQISAPLATGGKRISPAAFNDAMGEEVGHCFLNSSRGHTDEIMILKYKKNSSAMISLLSEDSQPAENYSNYPIYTVASPTGLQSVLWPLTENRNLRYFTLHDPYLLVAEDIDVLKGSINDIEEDNTWGKSAEWNTFFNTASLETNLSADVNASLLSGWMIDQFAPRWDSASAPAAILGLQKASIQFSRLNQNYYFSGALQFTNHKTAVNRKKTTSSVPLITFPEPVVSSTLVKNHTNNASELLIQTADKKLMLLDGFFKVLFKIELKEKITGQVYQIDYLKNKKLQYVFLAGRSLHIIDRLGNELEGFPRKTETSADPEFLSVFDYDNVRNYRFIISDQKGNLIMTDKEGKLLAGWESISVKTRLLRAPRFTRSGGKDYIICVDAHGTIHGFNRKGEIIKGFPVTSGIRPQGEWYADRSSADRTLITLVSSDGVRVQIGLDGKIANKENYVRSAPDSKFSLIVSSLSDDYAISRVDKGKIAILNGKGDVLFEKENPGSESFETSYVVPASGVQIFCFRDPQQDFTYLYRQDGKPLFNHPLESSRMPMMVQKPRAELTVFVPFNNDISRIFP